MSFSQSIPKILFTVLVFTSLSCRVSAQKYALAYHFAGKDTLAKKDRLNLQTQFISSEKAFEYISQLKKELLEKGYSGASIDSVHRDSAYADVFLFVGKLYHWKILADSIPVFVLKGLNLEKEHIEARDLLYPDLQSLENNILNYLENEGYPFARITMSDNKIDSGTISTMLVVDKGIQYHFDSIRVYGNAKIKNVYLQHYLNIFPGDVYDKSKLDNINKLMNDLPFLQQKSPWDLMMLGTGSTLNLYLQPKKSSQVNALIGFLPGNSITGKSRITADVRLNLRNALAGGETILINWQQLQAQSPRLDLGLKIPYIFNSSYGIDLSFGMLKQDSSWLLLNGKMGIEYMWSADQSFQVFYQVRNSYLLQGGVDTLQVIRTRRLPAYMDIRSASGGVSYHLESTDYKLNPRSGNVLDLSLSAGIRKVTPNSDVIQLKDPNDTTFDFASLYDTIKRKSYQATFMFSGAHFFPMGNRSTLKLGINSGWLQSPQSFQNELFRIGGYRLLRGFDEESIYADRYGVGSAEYRFLTGTNSYLFVFSDLGITHTSLGGFSYSNSYISAGLGLELETKAGLLNLSYAIGKRNDIKFDIRNASKIHFGYINYF